MSYGFEARNPWGKSVIGGGYHTSLVFTRKLVVAFSPSTLPYQLQDFPLGEFTYGKPPTVFYEAPPLPALNNNEFLNDTLYTQGTGIFYGGLTWISGQWHATFFSGLNEIGSLDVYVFTAHDFHSNSGWGLQVFNADGTLSYDSNSPTKGLVLSALATVNRGADEYFSDPSAGSGGHLWGLEEGSYLLPGNVIKPCIATIGFYSHWGSSFRDGGTGTLHQWHIGGIYKDGGYLRTAQTIGYSESTDDEDVLYTLVSPLWESAKIPVINGAFYD